MPTAQSDAKGLLDPAARAEFHSAYARAEQETILRVIASVHETTEETSDFAWLGNIHRMREFVGPRRRKSLKGFEYKVTDRIWESTIEVERKLVDNQQFPAIMSRVRDLAREAVNAKIREVTYVYAQGNSKKTYDGLNLLLSSGNAKRQNQTNLTSSALDETQLQNAITAMMQFTDEQGEPFGVQPTHLMVGPKLQWTARKLLESAERTGGSTADLNKNVLQGTLQLIINPWLVGTYDDYWFVIASNREVGPALLKVRSDVPTELTIKEDVDTSDIVFDEDVHIYGVRDVFAAVPGAWFLVYGGIL